jgi:Uma2 family endonuclease
MATVLVRKFDSTVLRRVPFETYVRLRDEPTNGHLRMAFHDGTLEIMSPEYIHEVPSRRLGLLIAILAGELGLPCTGSASTTFRRRRGGVFKGSGKEPDESFYLANEHRILGKATIDLDQGDPPPDLWIEVDNRTGTKGRLPVYASLGVPEVWRFDARKKTIWIGRLNDTGTYDELDRSVALPMLTRSLVLEGLSLGDSRSESEYYRLVRDWVIGTFVQPDPMA